MPGMDVLSLDDCLIELDDPIYGEEVGDRFDRAKITVTGDTPNATVTLRRPQLDADGNYMRMLEVDKLRFATVEQHGDGTVTIIGASAFLAEEVRTSDNRQKIRVSPGKRCANCG